MFQTIDFYLLLYVTRSAKREEEKVYLAFVNGITCIAISIINQVNFFK